jgi:hypothetical protein
VTILLIIAAIALTVLALPFIVNFAIFYLDWIEDVLYAIDRRRREKEYRKAREL